jgi:hypothetical protein
VLVSSFEATRFAIQLVLVGVVSGSIRARASGVAADSRACDSLTERGDWVWR